MRSPLLSVVALAAVLALPGALRAQQTATLVVTVADDSTGQPVERAAVRVSGGPGARAGSDGVARLAGVAPGTRVVEVERPGYAPARLQVEVEPGATQEVPIFLLPRLQTVRLEGVAATAQGRDARLARNGFYERQAGSRGVFVTAEEIAARHPRRLADVLLTLRGFALIPLKDKEYLHTTRTTGTNGGLCIPSTFVDGSPMADPSAILELDPDEVEAVEAYPSVSTVPIQYGGSDARCGVVLVWTRSSSR